MSSYNHVVTTGNMISKRPNTESYDKEENNACLLNPNGRI